MKKVLICLIVLLLFSLTSCIQSEGHYLMMAAIEKNTDSSFSTEYEYFDGYKKYTIEVDAGYVLRFDIEKKEGSISVKIEDSDGIIIYEKENMNSTSGEYKLEKGGKYYITITALETKGSYMFWWDWC